MIKILDVMVVGSLVYSNNLGTGRVEKISPSKSLVEVNFEDYPKQTVLYSSLMVVDGI